MTNIDQTPVAEQGDTSNPAPAPEPVSEPTPEPTEPQEETVSKAQYDEAVAEAAKYKRISEKKAKKAEKPVAQKKEEKSEGLDYGQKAYLNTKDIKESEHGFIEDQLAESGLELNELLNNGYFKAKLQELRDKEAVAEATPSGTRGAKESAKSKADYWVDRGELPPNTPENFKLRQDVVNKRLERETRGAGQFSSTPIIESGLA